jgi:membrane protein
VRPREELLRLRRAVEPASESRMGVVIRATQRYIDDGMLERAPTIAYYGILSLFPIVLLAFAGVRFVAGESAAGEIAEYAREGGASGAVSGAVRSAVVTAQDAPETSSAAAGVVGLLTLIYSSSRAFTATGRAVDAIGRRERLPRSLPRRAQDICWTLVLLLVGLAVVVLATVSGKVLTDILGLVGIDDSGTTVWAIVRWPVALVLALLIVAVVRWASPTASRPPFRLLSPGQITTVVALGVGTAGFNVYVTHLASYNATYGALAGAVILMLWIWGAGSVLLFGAELDAVVDAPTRAPTALAEPPSVPAGRS